MRHFTSQSLRKLTDTQLLNLAEIVRGEWESLNKETDHSREAFKIRIERRRALLDLCELIEHEALTRNLKVELF